MRHPAAPQPDPRPRTRVGWRGLRARSRLWSVPVWLIAACAAVFVLDRLLFAAGLQGALIRPRGEGVPPLVIPQLPLFTLGNFNVADGLFRGQLWRPVSFQFLHGGLFHLVFNCVGLWIFGPPVERKLGRMRFLVYYLLCGCGGALGYVLLAVLGVFPTTAHAPLVGASAGLFGLVVASMKLLPDRVLTIDLLRIDITVFNLGLVYLGVSVLMLLLYRDVPGSNSGGEAAHLGGAAIGFVLMRYRRLIDWSDRLAPRRLRHGTTPAKKKGDVETPPYMKYHGWR